jgi:PKD repeat protein
MDQLEDVELFTEDKISTIPDWKVQVGGGKFFETEAEMDTAIIELINSSDSASFSSSTLSSPVGYITFNWNWGDGQSDNSGLNPVAVHTYLAPGTYTILLTITDTLGCTDTATRNVFVDTPPYAAFTVSDSTICVGDPVFFKDTMAPFTLSFQWDFGDGQVLNNVHNPTHSWDNIGTNNTFTVTLTANYRVCPSLKVDKIIQVYNYPNVNLGPDTSICPGLTGSLLLTNINAPGQINQWSTGETASSITVTEPGRYWLKSTDGECSTTDSIWIKRDCYLNIPRNISSFFSFSCILLLVLLGWISSHG